ncbi:MAG: restriction endonuclease subunit S [Aquificaceae bacterium]|nr:restriction endonuclease subunit S [Aquificaceae bacterium]
MNNLWQLPEGWKWVKLGEVVNIRAGGTPSRRIEQYWGGSIPWVKISDIPEDGHVYKTEEAITEEGLRNSSAKVFPAGTILFSIFATIGKVGMLHIDAATNQAIAGLEIKDESLVDREYLFHCLKYMGSYLQSDSRGMLKTI